MANLISIDSIPDTPSAVAAYLDYLEDKGVELPGVGEIPEEFMFRKQMVELQFYFKNIGETFNAKVSIKHASGVLDLIAEIQCTRFGFGVSTYRMFTTIGLSELRYTRSPWTDYVDQLAWEIRKQRELEMEDIRATYARRYISPPSRSPVFEAEYFGTWPGYPDDGAR